MKSKKGKKIEFRRKIQSLLRDIKENYTYDEISEIIGEDRTILSRIANMGEKFYISITKLEVIEKKINSNFKI